MGGLNLEKRYAQAAFLGFVRATVEQVLEEMIEDGISNGILDKQRSTPITREKYLALLQIGAEHALSMLASMFQVPTDDLVMEEAEAIVQRNEHPDFSEVMSLLGSERSDLEGFHLIAKGYVIGFVEGWTEEREHNVENVDLARLQNRIRFDRGPINLE